MKSWTSSARFSLKSLWLALVLLLALVPNALGLYTEYYEILGLKPDATEKQLKSSYRKLSLKYHPDKNAGNLEAQKKFQEIAKAYDTLSDPDKRQIYDLHGEEGLKKHEQQAQAPASPFDALFGMGGQRGGMRKGPDFHVDFPATLEELYSGATRSFKVSRKVLCHKCRGTGAKDGQTKKCKTCGGKGSRTTIQQLGPGFNVQMEQTCDVCGGRGHTPKSSCPICGGSKVVMEEKALEAVMERGMADGAQIVFPRASEQTPDTIPGDVVVTVREQKHSRFRREGDHLFMEHTISLKEALLGFKTQFPHLDGHMVKLHVKGVTQPDRVHIIKGEGFPQHNFPSQKGDLHVTLRVRFPKEFTADQQQRIKALLQD